MTKKYPQLNSLNSLKEIFEILMYKSNAIEDNYSEQTISIKKLTDFIIFLENNYQKDAYSQLLIDYEITFIKLISIYNESIITQNGIYNEMFVSSKKLLNQFSKKVNEIRNNIEKNELIEKENKIKLDIEIKEKTKERLLKEIDDEIEFHQKK